MKNHVFFRDLLVNNFDFETLRGRKNDFGTKILLGTCLETSNYPWGYNIMASEQVLGRTLQENAKNV